MFIDKEHQRIRIDLVFGIPLVMGHWLQLIVLKELSIWTLEKMELMTIGSSIIKQI